MIDKLLLFPGRTDRGIFTHVIDAERNYLEKTAAEYHPTIASYIHNAKPIPGKTQILLTALGALEAWGPNVNFDGFPEEALAHEGPDYGYKTFETHARVYRHHINKDPSRAYGNVLLAVYNPIYKRVELIVGIDHSTGGDIVHRIEAGEDVPWSMGCRVPFDVCSICGNRAPTRADYCEHARYNLGRIDPATGKLTFVINTRPKFHDISQVLIGADRIAKTLQKVASARQFFIGSAELAEKMAGPKHAAIEKEVPVGEPPASQETLDELVRQIPEVKAAEPPLPRETLDYLARFPLERSMSTLASLGILPKPQEFQRIFLIRMGQAPLADALDRCNMCFSPDLVPEPEDRHMRALPMSPDYFEPRIMDVLRPFMADRSYARPHLSKRVVIMVKRADNRQYDVPYFIKSAEDVNAIDWDKLQAASKDLKKERKPIGIWPMLMAAAGLYAAFGHKGGDVAAEGVDKLIMKHPGLAAALGVGLATTFGSMMGPKRSGQFSQSNYVNPDVSDAPGFISKNKSISKHAGEFGSRSKAMMKRLFIGIPAAYMASGILQKHKQLNPYAEEGSMKSFVRKNPDVVGGMLLADAMLASRGKGTYGVLRKVTPHFRSVVSKIKDQVSPAAMPKSASVEMAGEVAKGLLLPMAMGGGNLPGRAIVGLAEQAIFTGIGKRLKAREQQNTPK